MFDFQYMIRSIPQILKGVPVSIGLAAVSFTIGLLIGFVIALIRIHKVPVLHRLSVLYVSFFRGTPLLVQIFLCYYGIPIFIRYMNASYHLQIDVIQIPSFVFICLSLTLNISAYLSETIRGAILSVPQGQSEAAKSLGMTGRQSFFRIILPQALSFALPNLGNTCISILKDTSLAFVASVPEIIGEAKIIAGRTSQFFEVYIVAALIYWALCFILEQVFRILEKQKRKKIRGHSYAANS